MSDWAVALRKVSDIGHFPYLDQSVTFIRISTENSTITQAKTKLDKRTMLYSMIEGDVLLAAWPVRWPQDIVLVDDLKVALQAVL